MFLHLSFYVRNSMFCISAGPRSLPNHLPFDRDIFLLVQWNKITKSPTWVPMSTPIPGSPQLSTIETNCLSTELVAILLDATPRINITVTSKLEARPVQQAFGVLSTRSTLALKICLVHDGLDEFEGDDNVYGGLGAFLRDITDSKHIKVLLSSRPLVVFEDLGNGPNLKLQNLTYRDIEKYVHDKFALNTAFDNLARKEPGAAPALLREIVEKADGVFVWVKLVVQNLLSGLRNRDDLVEL